MLQVKLFGDAGCVYLSLFALNPNSPGVQKQITDIMKSCGYEVARVENPEGKVGFIFKYPEARQ